MQVTPTAGPPVPVTVIVADVERFGRLTNPEQLAAREHLYTLWGQAFERAGVPLGWCGQEDRGDGVLIVAPATVPKPALIDALGRVAEVAALPRPDGRPPLRLRVAAHAGDIHHDGRGFVGADVNHAFRLAGSPLLHLALERTRTNCAVLVSDGLYQGTVRHGYGGLDPRQFHPAAIAVKETRTTGWLWIPGDDQCARRVAARSPSAGRSRLPDGTTTGVRLDAGGDMRIDGSVIAGQGAHVGRGAGRRRRPRHRD